VGRQTDADENHSFKTKETSTRASVRLLSNLGFSLLTLSSPSAPPARTWTWAWACTQRSFSPFPRPSLQAKFREFATESTEEEKEAARFSRAMDDGEELARLGEGATSRVMSGGSGGGGGRGPLGRRCVREEEGLSAAVRGARVREAERNFFIDGNDGERGANRRFGRGSQQDPLGEEGGEG